MIGRIKGTEGIKQPRAYAIGVLEKDREYWEEEFYKHQQCTAQTDLPPPVPPPKFFDERESLMGLIRHCQDQQKPLSTTVKQRAQELGIRLTGASTDGNDSIGRDTSPSLQAATQGTRRESRAELRSPHL
ncbi:hypothetical protein NDI45_27620 [Leptolyngbya sp. GB1-A1]|uniref:hypothetical protein n=1 Tax=Leptolyngbya sp. GB1-A1 TaxID=2933908 RepID=UPI003299ECDB